MDFVIPKSLLPVPIDTSESDVKLLRIAKQHKRSQALCHGFSSAAAPQADDEYGGYDASWYLGPQSINRYPPIVHYPAHNATTTNTQIKRRQTIATIGGFAQTILQTNQVFYPPIPAQNSSVVLPTTRTKHATVGGSPPQDISTEMNGLRRYQSTEEDSVTSPSTNHPQLLLPVSTVRSVFELSAPGVDGKMIQFSKFDRRMMLVTNVASGDKYAIREFTQLNDLSIAYASRGLTILAFPCNQFGGCEPYDDHEIPNCLRYVRPGRNFKPRFHLMSKCDVRGQTTCPVFEYLTQRLPVATDNKPKHDKRGHLENHEIRDHHGDEHEITDNFEKFLISPEGVPLRRYTAKTRAAALAFDIEEILRKSFPNKMGKSRLNLFETPAENEETKPEENGSKKRLRRDRITTH